jgi:hypothetical protein
MKAYEDTCPLCLGDAQSEHAARAGEALCAFCGLSFPIHDGGLPQRKPLTVAPAERVHVSHGSPAGEYARAKILPPCGVAAGGQLAI